MSKDIPVKDLPEGAALAWKNPEEPEGRHLTTDLIPFYEFLNLNDRITHEGRGLFPDSDFDQKYLQELMQDPVMSKVKDEYTFTGWSMEPDSITFLKKVIEMYKPQVVLELGSGLSTPILSAKMKEVWGQDEIDPIYVTIDQSEDYLDQTKKIIELAGTSDVVKPLIFPIACFKVGEVNEEGEQKLLNCYDFDEEKLFEACEGLRPDMIIIDGPTAGGVGGFLYGRMLTAPILSMYAKPNALICLDDSYRSTEIQASKNWVESGVLEVLGVKAVGKGLMMGLISENTENCK
tara:strand:+ start:309 stop:1181 length:873 start_codon:yes stop_codon:yes gene_type:complete